ncbi:MAG TPA: hypothetical protein VN928_08785 [Myxococcales bacterium]|nr:hypothetical protein [Myxococcales bacterium]
MGSFDLLSELLVLGGADTGLSMPASRLEPALGAEVLEPMVPLLGVVLVDDPVVAELSVGVPVVGDFSFVSPLITVVFVSVLVPVPTVVLPWAPVPDWPVVDPLTVPADPARVSSLDVPVGPAAPVAPVLPVVLVPVLPPPVCAKAPAAASAPAARILAA